MTYLQSSNKYVKTLIAWTSGLIHITSPLLDHISTKALHHLKLIKYYLYHLIWHHLHSHSIASLSKACTVPNADHHKNDNAVFSNKKEDMQPILYTSSLWLMGVATGPLAMKPFWYIRTQIPGISASICNVSVYLLPATAVSASYSGLDLSLAGLRMNAFFFVSINMIFFSSKNTISCKKN